MAHGGLEWPLSKRRRCVWKSEQDPEGSYYFAVYSGNAGERKNPMEILTYVQAHWIEWLFAAVIALLGLGYRNISARLRIEQAKNHAIAEGVQSLLRESLVDNYNKYSDRGYCPIYAKESIKKVYTAYHNLGGNDVATGLYHKLLAMPEEKEREERA